MQYPQIKVGSSCGFLTVYQYITTKKIRRGRLILSMSYELSKRLPYFSSHHSFSLRTCSSSLGVKSFLMLKVFLISSGVFPLIMLATVLQVTSRRPCKKDVS